MVRRCLTALFLVIMPSTQPTADKYNTNRDPRFRPVMATMGVRSSRAAMAVDRPGVALVRGPIVGTDHALNNEAVPAIGLAYIAGVLDRAGYASTIVDGVAEGLNRMWAADGFPGYMCQGLGFEETIDLIPADTQVIGFSTMFSGEWPVQRQLISATRKRFPDALIVIGGEHATALPEFCLHDCPAIDLVVCGEGEQAFLEIVDAVAKGEDPASVSAVGSIDKDGNYQRSEGLQRISDIDNIGWPLWPQGYLEKFWQAGKSYGVQTERDMPLMVSRGCPFQCTFCSSPRMWTTRYMLRDVEDVIAEMKTYIEEYNATAFQLYDLTAITKKPWAVELCRRMIEEGIEVNWSLPSGTRSEALDEEVLTLLKETGCNYLVYAPESGSPATLERIKKKISLDSLTQSALTAKKVGLILRTNLIIGFPGETRADIFRTIRFGLGLALKGVDEVSINIFSPYPGSELFEDIDSRKKVDLTDEYFLALTSLNSDYTKLNPMTVNEKMGSLELGFYRIFFMLSNYAISYLFYPSRIARTIRNIFFDGKAATVFEHRLKDARAKKKSGAAESKGT